MAKTNYVNGNILIRTRDFKYHVEDGCLFQIPEGANVLEPNEIVEGSPCFVIDDKNNISIFDTFRAVGGYTALESGSYYFNSSYQEVYENYLLQKSELVNFINNMSDKCDVNKSFVYKLIFMNTMTLLDSFVCELYISKLTSDEELFNKEFTFIKNKNRKYFEEYVDEYGPNEERAFIYYIRNQSYINGNTINRVVKTVDSRLENVITDNSPIRSRIQLRHDVAHNNAREVDGTFHFFTKEEVLNALSDVDSLVETIMKYCKDDSKI